VSISPAEARALGYDRQHKVEVVYNSIDLAAFDSARWAQGEARAALGLSLQGCLILSLGGVSHWKGTVELIEAMAHIRSDSTLILAGAALSAPDAPVSAGIRRLLAIEDALVNAGLQRFRLVHYAERVRLAMLGATRDQIRFMGMREDVPCMLAAADVVVFAGVAPQFPRPIFEAWAMKKPVVVFDVNGIADHVADGVDGVVVRDLSGQALGQALSTLIADPQRMRAMGEKGYAKACGCFDRDVNARHVARLYADITERARH
jgi:glycosyltransferase involved in cell wall biosynthesis